MSIHPNGCGCRECLARQRRREVQARYRQRIRDGKQLRPRRPPTPKAKAAKLLDIFNTPHMSGAACAGRWRLMDPPEPYEDADDQADRIAAAKAVCTSRCPVLEKCRDWVFGLQPDKRPVGIVAGRHITEKGEIE